MGGNELRIEVGVIKKLFGARSAVVLLMALALALPASALAQGGSTCQAYNPQLCAVAGQTQAKPDGTSAGGTAGGTAGALPFTGLDVGLLAVGGCVLLGGGMIVRRLSLRRE